VKAGKCDAVISGPDNFKYYVMDGFANKEDCDAEEAGKLRKEEAYCVRNSTTGLPVKNRDCGFGQVGDVLAAVPFAWAVSPYVPSEVIHALSWAIRQKLDQGAFARAKSLFAETPPSECLLLGSKPASDGLDVSALFGSAAASGCCVTAGILIAVAHRLRRLKADLTGSKCKEKPTEPEQEEKLGALLTDALASQARQFEALLKMQAETHSRIQAQSRHIELLTGQLGSPHPARLTSSSCWHIMRHMVFSG
jgi:hypothetical protein